MSEINIQSSLQLNSQIILSTLNSSRLSQINSQRMSPMQCQRRSRILSTKCHYMSFVSNIKSINCIISSSIQTIEIGQAKFSQVNMLNGVVS